MPSVEPERSSLSVPEVSALIRGLPEAGHLRLRKIARFYARTCALEADDLLQTAFARAIAGTRRCPAHVDAIRFLAEAMHSIASDHVKAAKRNDEAQIRRAGLRLVPTTEEDAADPLVSPPPTPEEALASEQAATRIKETILRLFEDDLTAQTIIEGDMEEMDADDIRGLTGLDKVAYASKRRFIRRHIEQAYPEGWKP